mgnify:CR=1 FL=1
MTKPTVGIIGLGAMGAGIAKTLRNNGFTIHVCDVRPGVADAFVADGGTAHATTAALAAVSDVVVSVVVNAAQTEALRGTGECIAQAVATWRFPAPTGGGVVTVNYPFNLQPADQ